MRQIYTEATKIGDTVNFDDLYKLFKGRSQLRNYFKEVGTGVRKFIINTKISLGNHHGSPRYIQRLFGITDKAGQNKSPAIMFSVDEHNAFHNILAKLIPENVKSPADVVTFWSSKVPEIQKLTLAEQKGLIIKLTTHAYDRYSATLPHVKNFGKFVEEYATAAAKGKGAVSFDNIDVAFSKIIGQAF